MSLRRRVILLVSEPGWPLKTPPPAGCTFKRSYHRAKVSDSPEPQHQGLAGTGVGTTGIGSTAGFLAFEPFFFGDFLAAGFFAADFLGDLAPVFFGDFLAPVLAAFFFLAIANDSFTL
jgi:hypothetical protein